MILSVGRGSKYHTKYYKEMPLTPTDFFPTSWAGKKALAKWEKAWKNIDPDTVVIPLKMFDKVARARIQDIDGIEE